MKLKMLGISTLSVLLLTVSAFGGYGADFTTMPDFDKDDAVFGNSDGDYGGVNNVDYEIYDASAGTFHAYRKADGTTWEQVTDNYQSGTAAGGPYYVQSMEFDNYNGLGHNSSGNLLACNFGNSYTGLRFTRLAPTVEANSGQASGHHTAKPVVIMATTVDQHTTLRSVSAVAVLR